MANYVSQINGEFVRSGTLRSSRKLVENGIQRTGAANVIVVGDSFAEDDDSILLTPGIPRFLDLINGAFVVDIQLTRMPGIVHHRDNGNETYSWLLEYEFDSDIDINNLPREADGTLDQSGQPGNPIFLPADFNVAAEIEYIPTDQARADANGRPFTNRFGESLSSLINGFETELATNVIRIQRWGVWPTPLLQLNFYNGSVNSDAFFDLPIGTAWMQVESKKAWYHGVEYARETYVIRVRIDPEDPTRENTWAEIEVPHISHFYLRDPAFPQSPSTRGPGGSFGPFYLKADGTIATNEADIEMLTFSPKRSVPWAPLNLPNR